MTRAAYDFSGKTTLVTGGAGDIGRATARLLGEAGSTVALLDNNEAALQEAVEELRGSGITAVGVTTDVTSETSVVAALARVRSEVGDVHLLFNNAGYQGDFVPAHLYDVSDFRRVMEVNVIGAFTVLRVVTGQMVEVGIGGAVVNSASYAGVKGPPNMVAYGASKFAVIGMTQSASKDLAPHGVRVNAVSPGLIGPGMLWTRQVELQAAADSQYFSREVAQVEREMIASVPMRRLGGLGEVADAVAFLLSDSSSFITGFNLELTGGQ